MNRKFFLITVCLVLAGLLLAAPAFAGQWGKGMRQGRGMGQGCGMGQCGGWGYGAFWQNNDVVKALNLSGDQIDKLEALEIARERDLIDLGAAVKKAQLDLGAVMKDRRPSQRKAEKAAADLNEAQGRLLQRQVAHHLAVNALLSDDQLRKLDELKLDKRQERREEMNEQRRSHRRS